MNLNKAKEYCRTLPGATEDIKWECNLVFSVGDKMFAAMDAKDKAKAISFKVDDDRFLELTDRDGIIPAPYLARAKWISMLPPYPMGHDELSDLLRRSHQLVVRRLPRRQQVGLLLGTGDA